MRWIDYFGDHVNHVVPLGTKDEKAEKTIEGDAGVVKEASAEAKVDQGHAVVERQDSRSKHRPLAKAASGGGPQSAPAEKSKGVSSPNSATAPPSGGAPSPTSATPPTSKQQGKRTERPKTPPAQVGGGPGPKWRWWVGVRGSCFQAPMTLSIGTPSAAGLRPKPRT